MIDWNNSRGLELQQSKNKTVLFDEMISSPYILGSNQYWINGFDCFRIFVDQWSEIFVVIGKQISCSLQLRADLCIEKNGHNQWASSGKGWFERNNWCFYSS